MARPGSGGRTWHARAVLTLVGRLATALSLKNQLKFETELPLPHRQKLESHRIGKGGRAWMRHLGQVAGDLATVVQTSLRSHLA